MATPTQLSYDPEQTPEPIRPMLKTLAEEYPIAEGRRDGAVSLAFQDDADAGSLAVRREGELATIHFDRPCRAARGIGALLSDLVGTDETYREQTPFETLGIMLDCSRNAVMTVEHFQRWLRRLALLGYNLAMLYTEQTYELEGEDYFGYLRGRYSEEELRRIDDHAASLGIEMIGCIQTLGHLEQTLKWPAYGEVRDTDSVLLVDADPTYELIEKMVAHFASCFRSRRIHVGMDETHDLGRGRFMDTFGYQRGFDIFNRHLGRVVEICTRHGLEPMIWSDMYFRMGSTTRGYYDPDADIPPDVVEQIPSEARLVYWDYYHERPEEYVAMIRKHQEISGEPVMASGVWTWGRNLWYDPTRSEPKAGACIDACREVGLKELLFTMWGDDGAYCEFDSALAGLAWCAEKAYAGERFETDRLGRRFAAICGADYDTVIEMGKMSEVAHPAAVLWDDPLLGIYYKSCKFDNEAFWEEQARRYSDLLGRLSTYAEVTEPIDLAHGVTLLRLLLEKVQLCEQLHAAYRARDKVALKHVQQQTPVLIEAVEKAAESFRRQWYRRNKPFGFETIQIRLGGLRQRYVELGRRIGELLAGTISEIPELDEVPRTPGEAKLHWRTLAAGGIV